MNGPFTAGGEVALQRSLSDVVAEYEHKLAALPEALKAFRLGSGWRSHDRSDDWGHFRQYVNQYWPCL